ncbi:MAG: class I SAM-dependent methyltransferase [Planctomycetaceae bacterium]|nr:class I SAM-dependent methyltransferase [Planctomycetales bacterium]MCB9938264.1 class I SAM-dependent methyltransferase [Planctomycetaceae bacterium]
MPFTETTLPTDWRLISLLPRMVRRVRDKGLLATVRRICFLANELYWERRLGIDTAGCLSREEISDDPASVGYDPIGYRQLSHTLRYVHLQAPTGSFLDYGCGKGRVLARAAVLPFDRILGVEISSELSKAAEANIANLSRVARCRDIQVVNANACNFVVPDDTTNIFLFNPFTGHLLTSVVDRIRESLERKPRALAILYILPTEMSDIFDGVSWMKRTHQHSWRGITLHVHNSQPSEI